MFSYRMFLAIVNHYQSYNLDDIKNAYIAEKP